MDSKGWADVGSWVQVIDEPDWTENATLANTLAIMKLYKSVDRRIKIYQTRWPQGSGTAVTTSAASAAPAPPGGVPAYAMPLLEIVDWWCPHVCQWTAAGVPAAMAELRAKRQPKLGGGRPFHITVYDNGVPTIESPWERLRTQPLDVWITNGTLDGTLSWYSVNSYGRELKKVPRGASNIKDPYIAPYPTPSVFPNKTEYLRDPAGWGYLLYPLPPQRRPTSPQAAWAPVESVRWVMTGAGLQDAEYLYALEKLRSPLPNVQAVLRQARTLATHFPKRWNPGCTVPNPGHAGDWGDDGYAVDPGSEEDGSSIVNNWRLAMGQALDAAAVTDSRNDGAKADGGTAVTAQRMKSDDVYGHAWWETKHVNLRLRATFDVTKYGGVGDGKADDSSAVMTDLPTDFKSDDDDVPLLPSIVPLPQHYEPGTSGDLTLARSFGFTAAGETSPTLEAALGRFGRLLVNSSKLETKQVAVPASTDSNSLVLLNSCAVDVSGTSLVLDLDTDESYVLSITAAQCSIQAETVYGAMHGMESFVQLVSLVAQDRRVPACKITDKPRFRFRATMIDTSRHYYPLQSILDHLDAMSAVKMNVLHWHIVDIESFAYVSIAFPQLSEHGAYHPTEVYTPADIKRVVEYAKQRGIRVIPGARHTCNTATHLTATAALRLQRLQCSMSSSLPRVTTEIDTPGHVWAGFSAIPGLLTSCYQQGGQTVIGTGPLDPTKEATFTFLRTLLAEIKPLFSDNMFMVGGDEVDFGCWQSNPDVVAFAEQKGWDNSSAGMKRLESYYAQRLLSILAAQNSSVMCWEELFDNGLKLAPDTVRSPPPPPGIWHVLLLTVFGAAGRQCLEGQLDLVPQARRGQHGRSEQQHLLRNPNCSREHEGARWIVEASDGPGDRGRPPNGALLAILPECHQSGLELQRGLALLLLRGANRL
eukprot:SAG11_NODE_79_length_17750_cov_28.445980_7_plen_928_part_00